MNFPRGFLEALKTSLGRILPVEFGSQMACLELACLRSSAVPDYSFIAAFGYYGATYYDTVYGSGTADLFLYNSIHVWPCIDGYALTAGVITSIKAGASVGATITFGKQLPEEILVPFPVESCLSGLRNTSSSFDKQAWKCSQPRPW